jgi:hypothetical protein
MWIFAWLACAPDDLDPPASADACARGSHPLRATCSVDDGDVVRWYPVGAPDAARETVGVDGQAELWGLRAGAATTIELPGGRTEELPAAELPDRFDGLTVAHEGEPLSSPIVVPSPCDGRDLVVVDPVGHIVGYEPFDAPITAHEVGPSGELLAIVARHTLVAIDRRGRRTLDQTYPDVLHHDLARDDAGFTTMLTASVHTLDGVDVVLDGLLVVDSAGAPVADWSLADHLPVALEPGEPGGYWASEFPDADDLSHGNSVELTDQGELLVSFRWLDAAAFLAADPLASDFGQVRAWFSTDDPIPSDWSLAGEDPVFQGQHHVSVAGDRLTLFDNGVDRDARALQFQLQGDVATLVEDWPIGQVCRVQGAAYPLADGGVLATCPGVGLVREMAAGADVARGSLTLGCDGRGALINRAIPIDW